MSSPASSTTSGRVPLSRLVSDYALYSENYLTIGDMDGDTVPFVWNRPQWKLARAVQWQEERGLPIRIIVLKSRKVGVSTWVQGFNFWRTQLRENRDALTLAHVAESSLKLFEIQRMFYDGFAKLDESHPLWVKKKHLTRRLITFSNRSSTQVATVGKGAGRGFTAFYVHASEFAFWEDAKRTALAIKNAVPKRPDTAVFVESTPNGWGNDFHRMWSAAKKGQSDYLPVFIGWYDDPRCRMAPWFDADDLDETEQELVRLYQVGLDQLAWRRNTIQNECDGDLDTFLQEYPSDDQSCFLASGRAAFDRTGLQYQMDALPQPDPWAGLTRSEIEYDEETRKPVIRPNARGRLVILSEPQPRRHYIVGVDPSEGDPGSTASPIAVLDEMDMTLAALWYGRTPPDLLAEHAVNLARYYNEAMLGWEANMHGLAFGFRVRELDYHNVYYRKVSEESVAQENTDKPGYFTSERSRQDLFNTGRKYVRIAPLKEWAPVRHPVMVEEMTTLVYEGDKAQAKEGALHDTLIAFFLCLFIHRGSMDSPLEPLPMEVLRHAYESVGWKLRMGMKPTEEDLLPLNCSAEELENFDQLMYQREQNRKRRGLGGMN